MASQVVSTGGAAAAAGALMTAGVAGEWVLHPQRDDGTVTNTPVFAVLVATATVGFVLLFVAVRGLRREWVRRTRPARTGAAISMVGAALLVVFGVAVLVTGVAAGSPLEASFLAFALGMLLLSIGPVTWGLALRRQSPAPGVWKALVLAGGAAFGAIAIPVDPWHDVGLVAMFAGWSAIGVLLLRGHALGVASSAFRDRSRV